MADLSAVLRKTIDGLPKATPQLRAKVYEKARAAIARQIDSANPPLHEDVIEARRSALEDAIDRTEDHYLELDAEEAVFRSTSDPSLSLSERADAPVPVASRPVAGAAPPVSAPSASPLQARPALPSVANGPSASATPLAKPAWARTPAEKTASSGAVPADRRPSDVPDMARPERVVPSPTPAPTPSAERAGPSRATPLPAGRPDVSVARSSGAEPASTTPPWIKTSGATTDVSDSPSIPVADVAAPRYANTRRKPANSQRGRAPLLVGLAVIVLSVCGGLAFVYQDEVQTFIAANVPSMVATAPATAPAPTTDTTVAALPSSVEAPQTTPPEAAVPPVAVAPPAAPPPGPVSTRRYTQRLLPDGSEVDEGPGPGNANAFEEGTNIAAASPETLTPPGTPPIETPAAIVPEVPAPAPEAPVAAPEAAAPPPEAPATVPEAPAVPPVEAPPAPAVVPPAAPTTTAALPPDTVAGVPAVAQKAVFYEERSETEEGTQRGGNVVWSVVNEPPSDGEPAEPAIRAVADVPEANVQLTMTIRRNADPTLPASHVIELMFDVPAGFGGGQIANVQRLALKPTEEARGEPLIGVAGKISDGFFIIALNNLAQATQTNLQLLGSEQWIDIPLAYATGRRALISIEKGIPGDRVFKEAMDAWAAKT